MFMTVKNFGPIQEGKFDLSKKFYVFVGYNNSGKTYMAHLLWTICNTTTYAKFVNSIVEYTVFLNLLNVENIEDLKDRVEITASLVETTLRKFADFIQDEMTDVFNIEQQHVISHQFSLTFHSDSLLERLPLNITIQEKPDKEDTLIHAVLLMLLRILFDERDPFYLPANRVFYPTFYDYVVGYERHLKKGKENQSRYTQPVDALITKMFDLNITMPRSNDYEDMLVLLHDVIGGDIVAKPRKIEGISPLIEYFLKIDNEKELEMYLSSSSVNQLTCLHLFFKHWAKKENNFLIIDEPEENLHPANQIRLLNLLITFANRNNNKVLLTTHSPLLAEAVNNHLHLGWLKEQGINVSHLIERHRLSIDPESSLTPEDVGVYFFGGNSIYPYEAEEYGVFFEDFRAVERSVRSIRETLTDEIYASTHKEN